MLAFVVPAIFIVVIAACGGGGAPSDQGTPADPSVSPTATATIPAGDPSAGKQIFLTNCATCHRTDASGGINFGNVTSADLRDSALGPKFHRDPALIIRAILQGKDQNGNALAVTMPRWSGKLTEQQAADVTAYLLTLTDTATSAATSSPAPSNSGYGMMPGTSSGCMGPSCMFGH